MLAHCVTSTDLLVLYLQLKMNGTGQDNRPNVAGKLAAYFKVSTLPCCCW
jgi:hypothetical protein